MIVLGISALYHDSAAALVKDGEIIAAAQEERFTRIKADARLPVNAMKYCMDAGNVDIDDIGAIVYYDNPLLTFCRFMDNLQSIAPDTKDLLNLSLEPLLVNKLWLHKDIERILGGLGKEDKLFAAKHHISHAASAFYPSPFKEAAILTIDGVGEYTTTAIGVGEDEKISLLKEITYPHSIGLLYSAFTYFCGFKVNFGDYKLMGLAPYGEAKYVNLIKDELIDVKEDGSYKLNLDYFDYIYGRPMTNAKFAKLFGDDRRLPESEITRREMDMSASVQAVIEEVVLKLAREAKKITQKNNLTMAGGVALNCVANGKLLRENIFDNIWIQPAAGDAGGALGAALYYYYKKSGEKREVDNIKDSQKGSYLGPEYSDDVIKEYLNANSYPYKCCDKAEIFDKIAEYIESGKVVGLFEGRAEYGPRALGNRSIIADARSPEMQSKLNLKIKYRESFRPFAPSVLEEYAKDYFELDAKSPYMLLCADVKKERRKNFNLENAKSESNDNLLSVVNLERSDIPAVTHVDYSARIQTVSKETNPFYHSVIEAFYKKTGCPVIINTSFNVRGEPIVLTPKDAYLCFMRTEMDILVMGNHILIKEEQPKLKEEGDWRENYALD